MRSVCLTGGQAWSMRPTSARVSRFPPLRAWASPMTEVDMSRGFRIGCDIGGTFTDFVFLEAETGAVRTAKRLTTPDDPSLAMLAGLIELVHSAPPMSAADRLTHATTLVANAVIERKGAKTALLCTAGFRDVLELRRYVRVTTYELFADPPAPLVPRHLRLP